MRSLPVFEERKPNFDLWLSGVGFPVHSYMHKNPHSCKDIKMATLLDFCRGMSRPVNWHCLMLRRDKTCGKHVSMWAGHVTSFFQWIFLWLLSIQSRMLHYNVLSALDFGELKRFDGNIYRNLRELSLFINVTWLWDDNRGNSYILIAFVD